MLGPPPGLGWGDRVPSGNPTGLSEHNRARGGPAVLPGHAQVSSGSLAELADHDDRQPGDGGGPHGGLQSNFVGPDGQGRRTGEAVENGVKGGSMRDLLQREVEVLRGKNEYVPGGNPCGPSERASEPRGRVSFDEQLGGARVPSGNPAGLSEHNRGGPHIYMSQQTSSTSGPPDAQQTSSTSGPSSWNPLGLKPRLRTTTSAPGMSATPPQGMDAGDSPRSPMDALLKGMSQLQQAMTMQMGLQATKPESIRPGVSGNELPKLVEADENAAINVGDWLHGLSGPMGDLTDGSSSWWSEVMKSLDDYYKEYLTATAVKRVQLRAEDFSRPMLQDNKWLRVDRRAASMLLQAVPDNIKGELMANRLSSTVSILGRILTIYRPGSSIERQQVLKALECPGVGSTPLDLVEILRKWSRWLKRSEDLGLQAPDASILLKGLDVASKQLMERNSEIAFRSNMLRFSLDLDVAPTQATVVRFHGHLLAEFEQLAYRGRGKGNSSVTPTIKNVAPAGDGTSTTTPKGGGSPSSVTTTRPCKFYAQESGCQRANCKFTHDWANIPKDEKADRCKGCGARGHMKRNCPMKSGSEAGRRAEDGKGGQPPKVRSATSTSSTTSGNKRDDGTLSGGDSSTAATAAASSSSTMAPDVTTSSAGSTTGGEDAKGGDMNDFLKNATQILKMMADKQGTSGTPYPSMKMLKRAVRRFENRMALVDSGATHPLREAQPDEWQGAPEVDVVIAGDGVTTMRQNAAGTLLTEPMKPGKKPQTIVPVGNLINLLGYELLWTKRRCVLRAPDGREESLKMTSGCPEVNEALALELIAKIEQEKVVQLEKDVEESKLSLLRAMTVATEDQWEKCLRRYVKEGKFEDGFSALSTMTWSTDVMKEDLVRTITDLPQSTKEAWNLMSLLGYNRRMRKRMMHKDWVVRLYSGRRTQTDKMFKTFENNGTMVLDVDTQRLSQLNMLRQHEGVMTLLLWGASTGRIAGVFASIPKSNSFEHALRVAVVGEVAKMGRKVMCELAEIPEDGVAMCTWASAESEEDESSTVWLHKWFRQWVAHNTFDVLHFEQGGLGHQLRRPTTMATNLDVSELRGYKDLRREWPTTGITWSAWAPMMMRVLAQGMRRWRLRPGWYTRMVKALKAVDRKAWERHLANDHLPHRADCLHCIHNSTGRPHRRCLHRDCYVLSADTLGPVRVVGPKGERFAVVFTYQFPKMKLMEETAQDEDEGELDGWDLDVKSREVTVEKEPEFEEEELEEYSPDGPGVPLDEAIREWEYEHGPLPEIPVEPLKELPTGSTTSEPKEDKVRKAKEDWWEFREAEGILIRHHVVPRLQLFRPMSGNGCPIPPSKLDPTRVTEVKFVGGGVDMDTSDWHGYKSGARSLDRRWTGTSTFKVSQAEVMEEEEILDKDEKSWEEMIGDLTKPMEMETIYLVYPVRARRGGDVMLAVQEAVLRLKLLGFPVARLHSDRGSEFGSKGLRKWLLDRDIFQTRSESLVPQTNGAAERGVRWFKTKAKVLLSEAGVAIKYWTLAMQHASNRQIYYKLGLTKPVLLPFGASVMIRRKVFGNNKKYDLTDRWEQGIYLGLSDTIKGGAIVLRPNGVLTETLNLRMGVVDPRRLLQEPPDAEDDDQGGLPLPEGVEEKDAIIDLPDPDHRLRGKQSPPALHALQLLDGLDGETNVLRPEEWSVMPVLERQERKARWNYEHGKFDLDTCGKVLQELDLAGKMRNASRGVETSTMVLGAFVHGGLRGVTAETKRRPWLMKYLNMVLRCKVAEDLDEDGAWTTLGVFRAADIPPHRDLRNKKGSLNYAIEIGGKQSGGLWVSKHRDLSGLRGGSDERQLQQVLPDGRAVEGVVLDIHQKAVMFDPKNEHAYLKPEVDRWVLVGFTPLGVEKLLESSRAILCKGGFPLEGTGVERVPVEQYDADYEEDSVDDASDEEELEHRARVLRCALQQEVDGDHQDLLEDKYVVGLENAREMCERELQDRDMRVINRLMKISPSEAIEYEVEKILEELQGPLEVVHNVSLAEARRYLDRWTAAIDKEVTALFNSGTIKKLSREQTEELKKCGLKVLPGKAVFTAKPPSDSEPPGQWYKRKCRIVVCGNFLPHEDMNVFASGTSADTLRIGVAMAVLQGWCVGSTDVSNAFTLAPMPKHLLYGVAPPGIVVAAGMAKASETWQINRVLYGLREAPRLWSLFRNQRLLEAEIPFEDTFITLHNLDTDENLWKICFRCEPGVTKGLLLVYVDDLLIMAARKVVECIYKWLVSEWKCSALEWIDSGALRFLGVELRTQDGGIHLSQTGYIRDLLRQHGVEEKPNEPVTVPCTREWLQDDDTDDESQRPEEATIRMAQKATGETLWLSTRSRPELAHSVACMASKALKKPQKTLEINKRVLQYLSKTVDYGILYKASADPMLVVYSDASYAPGGGRSFGCIMAQVGGMPAWRASKQPVITLSVAEAELYEGVAAVQLGLGVSAMITEIIEWPVMHLRIDNAAAQGLASEAPGSWKTRHLRVRARFLRQETAAGRLIISHVPGQLQKADIGTKGFDLPKFKELIGLWGIVPFSTGVANVALKTLRATGTGGVFLFVILCLLLVRGAEGSEEMKEDLPLDGSIEFYMMIGLAVVASVALWEAIKWVGNMIKMWINRCLKGQRKRARLQQRTKEAVKKEIQRQGAAASPINSRPECPTGGDQCRGLTDGLLLRGAGSRDLPEGLFLRGVGSRELPEGIASRGGGSRDLLEGFGQRGVGSRDLPEGYGQQGAERDDRKQRMASREEINGVRESSTRSITTQTEVPFAGPNWTDTRRMQAFEGPFFITPNGDCVHTAANCHGQRNATGPSKTLRMCRYCGRDRPLIVVGAPLG